MSNEFLCWPLLLGPVFGFCVFLFGVSTMEGVLFRKDDENNIRFRLDNIWEYLKLPFDKKQYKIAWGLIPGLSFCSRLKLWNLNWLIMVGCGTAASLLYYYL
jgi:hypothetical protein